MIVFKGALCKTCEKFLARKYSKLQFLSSIIPASLVSVLFVILAFATYPLMALGTLWFMGWPFILARLSLSKKEIEKIAPKEIYINVEDETIGVVSKVSRREHSISAVKQIIDYGEWYDIVFYMGDKDISAVIQKDLIVNGTIEEFEQLFKDKIVPAKSR